MCESEGTWSMATVGEEGGERHTHTQEKESGGGSLKGNQRTVVVFGAVCFVETAAGSGMALRKRSGHEEDGGP